MGWAAVLLAGWRPFLVKWGLSLGALGLSFLVGFFGGGTRAEEKAIREQALQEQRQRAEVQRLNDQLADKERHYEQTVGDLRAAYANSEAQWTARDAARVAALRSGDKRMRLLVAAGSCQAEKPGAVGAPVRADARARAELDPATAAALWGIAGDGDSAIRQLTALQRYTRDLWSTCSEKLR